MAQKLGDPEGCSGAVAAKMVKLLRERPLNDVPVPADGGVPGIREYDPDRDAKRVADANQRLEFACGHCGSIVDVYNSDSCPRCRMRIRRIGSPLLPGEGWLVNGRNVVFVAMLDGPPVSESLHCGECDVQLGRDLRCPKCGRGAVVSSRIWSSHGFTNRVLCEMVRRGPTEIEDELEKRREDAARFSD